MVRHIYSLLLFVLLSFSSEAQSCSGGMSGIYPCVNVNMMDQVSPGSLGGSRANDLWGWKDPVGGREYALVGLNNGTSFVDVTNSSSASVVGHLPTASGNSSWRDIKVYDNHAFIVSEAANHGMQVFDLTRLRTESGTFTADTTLTVLTASMTLSSSHNIVADEDNGFMYAVGTNLCAGGLVAIDVNDPKVPVYAGCFSADGYTHDAQIITKGGIQYALACNENSVTVVNVTNKAAMSLVSRSGIPDSRYIHQGWTTPDNNYFLVNDEFDEFQNVHNTRTHVFDISNLSSPDYRGYHEASLAVTDHNLYTVGNRVFQANYRAGLQIFVTTDLNEPLLTRVGYFDTDPSSDANGTSGAWSVYPYFGIDKLLVSTMTEGLFILDYNGSALPIELTSFEVENIDQKAQLQWITASETQNERFEIERSLDGEHYIKIGAVQGSGTTLEQLEYAFIDPSPKPGVNFYRLRQVDLDGEFSYSEVRSVKIIGSHTEVQIYPTVLKAGSPLNIVAPLEGTHIRISTYDGKVCLDKTLVAGVQEVSTANLVPGHYVLSVIGATTSAKKLVVIP